MVRKIKTRKFDNSKLKKDEIRTKVLIKNVDKKNEFLELWEDSLREMVVNEIFENYQHFSDNQLRMKLPIDMEVVIKKENKNTFLIIED